MQFKRTKLEPAAWKWLCWELREVEDLKSRRRQFVGEETGGKLSAADRVLEKIVPF